MRQPLSLLKLLDELKRLNANERQCNIKSVIAPDIAAISTAARMTILPFENSRTGSVCRAKLAFRRAAFFNTGSLSIFTS